MSLFSRLGAALPSLDPFSRATDAARLRAVDEVIAARASDVDECRALCEDAGRSLPRIDALARDVLHSLRAHGPFSALDTWVRSEEEEILDADDVDAGVRGEAMRRLEALNQHSGAHALFAEAIDAALGERIGPHVYEVAAGTGGLARLTGPRLRRERPQLRWTISDLDLEVLTADGPDPAWLHAEARDVLDLGDALGVDLFVCAQAAHHLGPGLVVSLLAQAKRAPLGVLILDVHRGGLVAGLAGLAGVVLGRNRIVALDGMRSARRAFTPAELALLARLAGARVLRAEPLGPAYAVLHAIGA